MTSPTLQRIRDAQLQYSLLPEDTPPPAHQPDMLLIGCVDARLNIKNDLEIPDGRAIIYRNIAALVAGESEGNERISEAATLEFAVEVMKVKDIVVMGHTDCGGIRACLHQLPGVEHMHQYLAPLDGVRLEVVGKGGNLTAQARAMEEAAVRESVANLMTYDVVKRAVKEGRLDVHGWVVNTATKQIREMDLKTGVFAPMTK